MKRDGVAVEKFKLTKPQLSFQKQYGKLAKVGRLLQTKMARVASEGATLSQLMKQVEGQMGSLLEQAPAEPTRELSGQPE